MKQPFVTLSWFLQILVALVLLGSVFPKFTAAPESVALFTALEMEPSGRILVGVIELFVALLLLVRTTVVWGALLGAANMAGAVIAHATKLGFTGDYGLFGFIAVGLFLACLVILYLRRRENALLSRMFACEEDTRAGMPG